MVGLVIPAAGRGSRYGSSQNKIWQIIGGKSVLEWTLQAFEDHPDVDVAVLVGSECDMPALLNVAKAFSKVVSVVKGGPTRAESVLNGLNALPSDCSIALIHDAARPAVSYALISRVVASASTLGCTIPGTPVVDTIKRVNDSIVSKTVDRSSLIAVQTPQAGRLPDILNAYKVLGESAFNLTDEAAIMEIAGYPVHVVDGDADNIKITVPNDLDRVKTILEQRESPVKPETIYSVTTTRTGMGYDVHPFAEGRDLWLGGAKIPNHCGLAGHSDADAMLHAVCDALLGAAALGDIGLLFPDTEDSNKDRPSLEFVREVRRLVEHNGWKTVNIDVMLLAETPRIGPYRTAMREAIGNALGITIDQVNIKATTSEKMGFVGRREGIACWAIATIAR